MVATVQERKEGTRQLKDLIVSKIVELGCACSTDLAGQIGGGTKPQDLVSTLDSLVENGVLRRKEDKSGERDEHQIVYELAR